MNIAKVIDTARVFGVVSSIQRGIDRWLYYATTNTGIDLKLSDRLGFFCFDYTSRLRR